MLLGPFTINFTLYKAEYKLR